MAEKRASKEIVSAGDGEPVHDHGLKDNAISVAATAQKEPALPQGKSASFPIVGVGASAGGLEAFTQLLKGLPLDTGMGFVLVQHLDPEHESALTQLLARTTSLPVQEITNDQTVKPNHVYVIPRDTSLEIVRGVLKLQARERTRVPHRPIDSFFESLAADQRERAIGVVLSGTASDGTLGLEAIKAEGGITFAQDDSARHDSMPRSAVAAGCVDLVLSPAEIAKELARIAKHPYIANPLALISTQDESESATMHEDDDTPLPSSGSEEKRTDGEKVRAESERGGAARDKSKASQNAADGFKKILLLLRNHSGVDFSLYKSTTIQRRIARRVVLNKRSTPEDYANFLRGNAHELDALYSDVLISVTSFFRNPEAFEALEREVFPKILSRHGSHLGDDPVRVWVLGCSTGQEAYSIAMAFVEVAEKAPRTRRLQVFATDLNDKLLDKARHGLYAKSLVDDVTPERLRRFFIEEEGGYRIAKMLREMVVFARQNLINDPPFSRMDLISCRNLLIYLEPSLQKKALPTFHYALKPDGFLMLGASESIGGFTNLFETVDKKQKIYSKKPAPTPALHLPARREHSAGAVRPPPLPLIKSEMPPGLRGELDAQREADRVAVNLFAPPGALINADLQVLQFRGPTGAYLEPPMGKASFDVLKMAREGLMLPLRAAINQAKKENKTAYKENVRVRRNGETRTINLRVIPLKNLRERCFLILFEDAEKSRGVQVPEGTSGPEKAPPLNKEQEKSRIAELDIDLAETREYLQSVQEQNEAANEELQAANEEVQSANEELQSINEELETSKEELESANEELTTVNEEMSNRNIELNRLNNDLVNLQNSTKLAIVLLGRDITIRRFNTEAEKQFDLLPSDVGRPISNIRHNLVLDSLEETGNSGSNSTDLETLIAATIATVREQEFELQDRKGRWYSMRLRPYMTLDNKVDGAVLVLVDIDALKRGEQAVAHALASAENTIETMPASLLVLDRELRVELANKSFYRTFKVASSRTIGTFIYELGNGQWNIPRLRELLEEILPQKASVVDFEVEHEFEHLGRRIMLINAVRNLDPARKSERILLTIEDITDRKRTEITSRESAERYQTLFNSIDEGFCVIEVLFDSTGKPTDYRFLETNPAFDRQCGLHDVVGKRMRELAPSHEAHWFETFGNVAMTGKPIRFVNQARELADRWFDVYAFRIGEAESRRVAILFNDISEKKQSEYELRKSEIRHRRLFETAYDGILMLDSRSRVIIDANPFMMNLLDYPREYFIGKQLWEIGLFRDEETNQEAMQILQEKGSVRYDDLSLEDRNGRRHPVEIIVNLYQEDLQSVIQCNIRDISERKRFADEREAHLINEQSLRMEAEGANRAKDMFLATLSHEMRTPLNAIVGWMSILRNGKCGDEDYREGLDVIDRNTKAQVQLIEDVLDVSRIVSGKLRLEIRPCDLADAIKAGIDAVRPAAEAREITLNVNLDAAASRATCDAVRIQQVVWNLVSNAVKFTPKGGAVGVTLNRHNSSTQIQVSDTGQGISAELLPFVFDRFRQADSSSRRRFGGLGLGLSIVKHLVELHGGTIQAYSAGEGGGATFTIELPIKSVHIDESPVEDETGAKISSRSDAELGDSKKLPLVPLDGLRVLVVDDEADARRLLVKVLESAGAIVTAAASVAEALAFLPKAKPEVLVSDLGMPEQDGYDLIRQVRTGGHHPRDLPAVALTAFAHKDDQRQALLAGFQVHVPKPVDPHDLTAVIASLAGRTGI